MKHIRYTSDNRTLCAKPSRLGHDFVVIDTSANPLEDSCRVCSDLLFAFNLEEFKREQRRATTIIHNPPPTIDTPADVNAFLVGFGVSSVFWIVIFILALMVGR